MSNKKTLQKNKEVDSLFIKVPNGIIEMANSKNSYLALTYLFLIINRNMLGKVNNSVIELQETYLTSNKKKESTKSKCKKINDIISSLYVLSNTIVNKNKQIISEPIIDIVNYNKYFDCCEFNLNTCIEDIEKEKNKLFSDCKRFQQYKLSIRVDNSTVVNNFTTLSIEEYRKLMYACFEGKKDYNLKVENLVNIYLLFKMIINRRSSLNKTFPNGWKYNESVTLKYLVKKTNVSRPTLRKYMQAITDLGLAETDVINNTTKEIIFKLSTKEENN